MTAAAKGGARRSPRRARWALAILAPLFVILGLESLGRGWACARGKPYSAAGTRADIERTLSALTEMLPRDGAAGGEPSDPGERRRATVYLHPYFGFEIDAFVPLADDLAAAQGSSRRPQLFQILVLGGSAAGLFGHEANGARETLERLLQEDPHLRGRTLQLLSAGRGAWKQPQQLAFFTYLLGLGVQPDAVLCIDGFNEVAIAATNQGAGVHPLWPSSTQWGKATAGVQDDARIELIGRTRVLQDEARAVAETALARDYARSFVLGRWTTSRLTRIAHELAELRDRFRVALADGDGELMPITGPAYEGGPRRALEDSVRMWAECARMLHDLCAARGIPYLHVLQPTLLDEGSKVITEEERERGRGSAEWTFGVQLGYPWLREQGARLAADGVPFLDASTVFVGIDESIYYDTCHFGREGNTILAEAIGAALLEVLAE